MRQIKVYQLDDMNLDKLEPKYVCFLAISSYKRPDKHIVLDSQKNLDSRLFLENVTNDIKDIPLAPEVDIELVTKALEQDPTFKDKQHVHPIQIRKLGMDFYNKQFTDPTDRCQVHYLKSSERLPDDRNLHIAALLYASDRNSLFTIVNLQDQKYHIKHIASIDHAFVMHNLDTRVDEGWLTMQAGSNRSVDGRGLYSGQIYDDKKRLVCSFMQDGVVRVFKDDGKSKL